MSKMSPIEQYLLKDTFPNGEVGSVKLSSIRCICVKCSGCKKGMRKVTWGSISSKLPNLTFLDYNYYYCPECDSRVRMKRSIW